MSFSSHDDPLGQRSRVLLVLWSLFLVAGFLLAVQLEPDQRDRIHEIGGRYMEGGFGAQIQAFGEARRALEDLAPSEVVLVGGPAALHPAVEAAVAELGIPTRRVAGGSRYD
ncbi:MAG: hypothetical protein ABGZ17_28890, partial [Planctomycetaceae bacterium]